MTLAGGGSNDSNSESINVPERAVFNLDDCSEVSLDDCFTQIGEYELPFGTLMWTSNDNVAACLIPTDQASPLTQVTVLLLESGNYFTVLEQAIGTAEGFVVFDARANEQGIVWTEANVMAKTWRILCAPLSADYSLG
ncbi:MAG: hypothetical protein J5804_04160, partial [Eggerthellaceae bacterium]|nr:hypothetical protein [Eggerthellaceae bacterium]